MIKKTFIINFKKSLIDSYEFHGIGIDDIVFTKSYCNPFPAQATVSPVTTKTTSTTTKSASFEINSSKKKLKDKLIIKIIKKFFN